MYNPFHATGLLLYPRKIENLWSSNVFKGLEKDKCMKGVKNNAPISNKQIETNRLMICRPSQLNGCHIMCTVRIDVEQYEGGMRIVLKLDILRSLLRVKMG